MNKFNTLIIYISIFTGISLLIGGSYILVDNLMHPKGLLFESVMSISIGITLLMIVLIASTIGKTIMMFDTILNNITTMYEEIIKQEKNNIFNPFNGIIGQLPNSITITNKESGEEITTPIKKGNLDDINRAIIESVINSSSKKKTPAKKSNILKNLTLEELEDELSKAVISDDFERADSINKEMNKRIVDDKDKEE